MTAEARGTESSQRSMKVSRRGFLALGSAAAAAPVLGALRAPALGASATEQRLSIGYVVGSHELLDAGGPLLTDAGTLRIVAPARAGGPRVRGAARVTAHHLYPADAAGRLGAKAVDLDVLLRDAKTGKALPVYLWSKRGASTSAPAGITLPASSSFGLRLRVSEGADSLVAKGRLGGARAPLRRGVYMLGLGAGTSFSSLTLGGILSSPRPSLVLSVDNSE